MKKELTLKGVADELDYLKAKIAAEERAKVALRKRIEELEEAVNFLYGCGIVSTLVGVGYLIGYLIGNF